MRHGRSVVAAVAWPLVAGVLLAPTAALADRSHGRPVGDGHAGDAVVPRPLVSQGIGRPPVSRRPFFHRRDVPFAAAPVVVYALPPPVVYSVPAPSDPPVVYNSTVVYSAPAVYNSPAVYAPPAVDDSPPVARAPVTGAVSAPSPPATPSVIEYPTGRYELRGDGVTVLYTWVWIPNPPPAPPESAPPAPAPAPAPAADDPGPGRQSQLYRWTDAQGVTHWTNRADAVPDEHRGQAKRSATGR